MGEATPHETVAKILRFNLRDGIAEQISCPTLVLDAEQDIYLKGQPDELYAHLTCQENSPAGLAAQQRQKALFDSMDREDLAPSTGLRVSVEAPTSAPDGNTIKIRYIRPDSDETLPCVYYIHGGRMEMNSCFDGNYRTWARMIATRALR